MAASTIMWLDEASRTAEFEPVGTHPGYRRLGLGTAMLLHGTHLARAAGATHMTVACLGAPGHPSARGANPRTTLTLLRRSRSLARNLSDVWHGLGTGQVSWARRSLFACSGVDVVMRGDARWLVVVIFSALLAAGCASAARPGLVAGAVPWVNRPAPVFTPAPQPSPTAAYPACRAGQLTGRPGRGGPAAGTVYQEVRLTNDSGRPCTLSGGPTAVTGVRSDGSLITLTTVAYGDGANLVGPGPANLRPGQGGWLTLAYADGCPALASGGRADYRTLLIALGRGHVRIDFPASLNLVCGLQASTFGALAAPSQATTSPLNVLAATVRLPAALTAGRTASYSVILHNTSGTRLSLSRCPSYAQYLAVDAGHRRTVLVQQRFYLNCAAVRQIPAHGSVTFAMRIRVPAASGRAKYDWQLQDTDVATAGVVTIRRASPPEPAAG